MSSSFCPEDEKLNEAFSFFLNQHHIATANGIPTNVRTRMTVIVILKHLEAFLVSLQHSQYLQHSIVMPNGIPTTVTKWMIMIAISAHLEISDLLVHQIENSTMLMTIKSSSTRTPTITPTIMGVNGGPTVVGGTGGGDGVGDDEGREEAAREWCIP